MSTPPTIIGSLGKAWRLAMDSLITSKGHQHYRPDYDAGIDMWIVHVPTAHPFWPQYALSVVHLRDLPGVKLAKRDNDRQTHEIMLVAFNVPRYKNITPDNINEVLETSIKAATSKDSHILHPLNMVVRLEDLTDEQAKEVCEMTAKACVNGYLKVESDDYRGAHDFWKECMKNTCEHVRLGGHPKKGSTLIQ